MNPTDRRVVILGAGPAGLTTAHLLSERGVSVDVLELKPYVGGLCATFESNGFRFDLGGHRWFTKNQDLHNWFLKLMEGELVNVKRTSRIYFNGKYFNYPISIKNVLRNVGPFTSAAAVLSYLRAAAVDLFMRREPQNMKDAYCAQFGEKLFDMFFRRYSEKVWGTTCDYISADWVSQRSKGLSILTTLRDALLKSKNVVSLIDEFVYPRLGFQRVPERMAEDVVKFGGRMHLQSPVQRIVVHGPSDIEVFFRKEGGNETLRATDVVSTIPLSHLLRMIEPQCEPAVLEAALSLTFRDLITVTVMLRKPQVTPDTWLYVHDEDLIFARLHEPKNWSRDMVPGPEYTSVVCECFCSKGDDIWKLSDEEISNRVVGDLADKLHFIRREEVLGTYLVRSRYAYPVYDLNYKGKLALIYSAVDKIPGIHIAGRGGTFRYNNSDHSIEMGQLVARKLLGEELDPMAVNLEQEYQEIIRNKDSSKAG